MMPGDVESSDRYAEKPWQRRLRCVECGTEVVQSINIFNTTGHYDSVYCTCEPQGPPMVRVEKLPPVQLEREPKNNEAACADCGRHRDLFGGFNLDGTPAEDGDFVCRWCARNRGYSGPFPETPVNVDAFGMFSVWNRLFHDLNPASAIVRCFDCGFKERYPKGRSTMDPVVSAKHAKAGHRNRGCEHVYVIGRGR